MKLINGSTTQDVLGNATAVLEFLQDAFIHCPHDIPMSDNSLCGAMFVFEALRSDLGELRDNIAES